MITRITAKLIQLTDDAAILSAPPFDYEVLIAAVSRRTLSSSVGQEISLHTIHYLDGDPSRGKVTPRLVGFVSEVEREFFEMFCSVDGVGAKKALRAMQRPVQEISVMIEEQDAEGLSSLPGIGAATAERIIAKLRRKMSKFALLVARESAGETEIKRDVVELSFEALRTLGHSESDARKLLDSVLKSKKKFADVEAVLSAIYQQNQSKSE
ncbi:DNA recombination protein RuvA domain I [Pirellula staleyi DSM 6068]|uniref:Holliday junction branch migration complex subunit RuvA n=1 Tax=Pirellula staleyi (strain ATCC 27377 / DSM 6068 / ICPB 4128) TaxID=530564 RepID=D2QZ56_PIRSD|nr:Holliday junction branch migration protein RuvA [Pirellula staleyi]ADB18248.1 DNA recombination protein RuvA domain I [Pirellula staleyi DSM 6068]